MKRGSLLVLLVVVLVTACGGGPAPEDPTRVATADAVDAGAASDDGGSTRGAAPAAAPAARPFASSPAEAMTLINEVIDKRATDVQKCVKEYRTRKNLPHERVEIAVGIDQEGRLRGATLKKGEPIKGDYKFTDEFPMSEGFEENAAFFTLTYEAPLSVRHNRAFERVAPMLWLRAGSRGRIIYDLGEDGWDVADSYGVLENIDQADEFVGAMSDREGVEIAYVVTDDDSAFQMVCRELPSWVVPVRLYESYLQNFEINTERSL